MGRNLFTLIFIKKANRDMVLKGCPWYFNRKLIILDEMPSDQKPKDLKLLQCLLWARVYDLPVWSRKIGVAKIIGDVRYHEIPRVG